MPYKIYAAEIKRMAPPAIIIISAFKNYAGFPRAESFLVVPGQTEIVSANKISFDIKSFDNSPVVLDDDFMLEEALTQAKIDLASYLEGHYDGAPHMIPLGGPEVRESDMKLLVHAWVRDDVYPLNEVKGQTENEALREDLFWITQQEVLRKRKIK